MHVVNSGWKFNGDYDRPTFQPSVLVRSGHYAPGFRPGDNCWCTYNADHPDESNSLRFNCEQCHSFVIGGQIQFLNDCSHALAGKTVPLQPPVMQQ